MNYSSADGLPSNTVYAIAQDTDGVLWVRTLRVPFPLFLRWPFLPLAKEAAGSVQSGGCIRVNIPDGLVVRTDRNMLLTCLRNLLDNAVKASPEGGEVVGRVAGTSQNRNGKARTFIWKQDWPMVQTDLTKTQTHLRDRRYRRKSGCSVCLRAL